MESYIPTILENFLGEHRKHAEHRGQISYDCPACSQEHGLINGDGKGNLEINYNKGVFKCWVCKDTNKMSGTITNLIKKYGSKDDLKSYLLLKPDHIGVKQDLALFTPIELPEGMQNANNTVDTSFKVNEIKRYLKNRGLTESIIDKFDISYSLVGKYKNRIIIPSYNEDGKIEYFVTRAFNRFTKPKYLNPEVDKSTIIFFEDKINWNSTVYLVEGVFDAIVIPNAIPLLGKYMSDKLFKKLQEKAKGNIVIILDGDAIDDAKHLYQNLNVLKLLGRIKIIFLNKDYDLSLINQKFGKRGLIQVLKTASFLSETGFH